MKEKEKILSKAEDVFLQLKQADKEDSEALEAAQRKFQAVSSGLLTSEDGQDATLQDQLMSELNKYNKPKDGLLANDCGKKYSGMITYRIYWTNT